MTTDCKKELSDCALRYILDIKAVSQAIGQIITKNKVDIDFTRFLNFYLKGGLFLGNYEDCKKMFNIEGECYGRKGTYDERTYDEQKQDYVKNFAGHVIEDLK